MKRRCILWGECSVSLCKKKERGREPVPGGAGACQSVPDSSRITSPAMRSPATGGTKAMLAGAGRPEPFVSPGVSGLRGVSSEYRTFKAGISRFFNSLRMTRHRGQTLVE